MRPRADRSGRCVDGQDPRQPDTIGPVDYLAALAESASGLRVDGVREGFGTAVSQPGVDESVRAAVEVLRSAGLAVGRRVDPVARRRDARTRDLSRARGDAPADVGRPRRRW
jgi:Asp-tRNA(Asn)/Glu-tRNA(Gln) amidotransferase A subunit family amidase